MIMEQISELIKTEELEDVLVIGYLDDDDEVLRFVPLLNYVYLVFESNIIRVQRRQSTDFQIYLEVLGRSNLSCEKHLHSVFEDYKFCTSSLLGMFFYEDRGKAYVEKIEMYIDTEEKYAKGIVKCLGLEVRNNSYIFLNPLSFHSLEIGKREERNEWFENVPKMKTNILMDYNPQNLKYKEIS